MSIPEWTEALERCGLLLEFADVLQGFENGFNQGIPQHTVGKRTKYFTLENHSLATQAREKIELSILKEIKPDGSFAPIQEDK